MMNFVWGAITLFLFASNQFIFAATPSPEFVFLKAPPAPGAGAGGAEVPATVAHQDRERGLLGFVTHIKNESDIRALQEMLTSEIDIAALGSKGDNVLHGAARLPLEHALKVLHILIEYIKKLPEGRMVLASMINARDASGRTPLMVSLMADNGVSDKAFYAGDVMRLFRVYHANFALADNDGKNALDYAVKFENKDAAEAIKKFIAEDAPTPKPALVIHWLKMTQNARAVGVKERLRM